MQQLNIVGFSKDGIDARVYLQGGTYDGANSKLLIQYDVKYNLITEYPVIVQVGKQLTELLRLCLKSSYKGV